MTAPTLVEFLRARLDEDEAVARGAIDPERPGVYWQWETPGEDGCVMWLRTVEEYPTTSLVGDLPAFPLTYDVVVDSGARGLEHIARHDPARVLADVEAKRRIVDLHSGSAEWCGWSLGGGGTHDDMGNGPADCDTLMALALPYRDHPDYDERWAV